MEIVKFAQCSILSSWEEWSVPSDTGHMDFAWIKERFTWVTNHLQFHSGEPLWANNKLTETSLCYGISWNICTGTQCIVWLSLIIFFIPGRFSCNLTIIREQTFMHIRTWKPKELSTICFNFKRFQLRPLSFRCSLACHKCQELRSTNPEGARQPQLQSGLYLWKSKTSLKSNEKNLANLSNAFNL